jgi:hypothetical protein
MKPGLRGSLTAVLAVFAIGYAQQSSGDLATAASNLLRQFGGDGAAAVEAVERLAALPPEALTALLEGAGAAGSVVPEVLRLAGVPEPLLEDPAATLAAARFVALDTRGAIGALNAAVAQAPPAGEAGPASGAAAPSDGVPGGAEPVAAETAPAVSTAVSIQDALGVATWVELVLVLVSWVTLTWVFFFFFWRVFMSGNPFLAVRLAYSISVVAVLAYLALVFWPKFFAYALPADFGYVPYVTAGVLAALMMIGLWTSYRSEVDE